MLFALAKHGKEYPEGFLKMRGSHFRVLRFLKIIRFTARIRAVDKDGLVYLMGS